MNLFHSLSLRRRFLVAPLLGLVVWALLTAAFIFESRRQNAVIGDITAENVAAFNRYSAVFTNLTEQHMALYELLYNAANSDEEALYEQAKLHLYKIQRAIDDLEETLRHDDGNEGLQADFIAHRHDVRAKALTRTRAYRDGVTAALRMATATIALAPRQLALANERFTAMNGSLLDFLEMERTAMSMEISATVRHNETNIITFAFVGVSIAALLFVVSLVLGRLLARSLEAQINALTELGTQAGVASMFAGGDEVARMTQAIAAFRQSLLELRESERRFSDLLENVELVSVMLDREARITYCNEYLLRLTGWRREEVIGRNWFELFVPPEIEGDVKDVFPALLGNLLEARHVENEILTRAGGRRLIRWNNSVLRSGAGEVTGAASIGEDITERKESEHRIAYLNRVYAMLSGINTLIVRVADRDELFREACRIALEAGGFRMIWIGVLDRSAMKIVPLASAGLDEEVMAAIKNRHASSDDATAGNSLSAQALRDRKVAVSNDSASDPRVVSGKKYAESGVRSVAILPLIVADEAVGLIALYAGEIEFFHKEELKLLTELAGDISFALDHLKKEEKLNYLAYYDAITGLANRALFHERLEQRLTTAKEQGHKLALVLLDVERFKTINDTFGRPAGDVLLKDLAARMSRHAGDAGRLARIDADHFAVMVPEVKTEAELARLVERRVGEVFGPAFRIDGSDLRISAKFGIAMFPGDGADADTLFKNAEAALKNAKTSGERYLFYTGSMNARVAEKLVLENQLRQALDNGEFVLHYQPKVNLASGKMISAEALIRWNDPTTGLVPPGRFIPILEETGLIYEVGRWALRQAIADYLRWCAAGLPAVRIAVNVSPLQLRNRGFVAEIEQVIGIDAQAAAGLELEITESLIMEDVKHNIASLQAIRALGVTIAIDDFGTGFSSLSYLAKLPVDTLKIDRSFVIDMMTGHEGAALVSTIINLAHSLKLKVVAEGVEIEEQRRLLHLLGCDEMQGYLFSKPVPGEMFEAKFLALPAAA